MDSNLVSRYLTASKRALVASPDYLNRFGNIESHLDLKAPHQMIEVFNKAARLPKWHLQPEGGESVQIDIPCQLRVNTITACLTACIDGLGIAVLPEFICLDHFKSGMLVRLLPEYKMPEVSVSLVYADRQLMPKRKKVFIDYLLTAFKQRG